MNLRLGLKIAIEPGHWSFDAISDFVFEGDHGHNVHQSRRFEYIVDVEGTVLHDLRSSPANVEIGEGAFVQICPFFHGAPTPSMASHISELGMGHNPDDDGESHDWREDSTF